MLFGACSFAGHSMLLKDVIREADWCVCIRTSYAKKKKKIVPLRQAISQSRRASPFYCPESLFFFPKRVFTRWRWQNSCRDAAFETNYAKSVTKMIHAMRTRQQPWPAWAPAVHVPWTEGWMDGWLEVVCQVPLRHAKVIVTFVFFALCASSDSIRKSPSVARVPPDPQRETSGCLSARFTPRILPSSLPLIWI